MKNKIIAKIRKNALEEIRIGLNEFKNKEIIDLRVWLELPSGDFIPTKKGIAFSKECLASLLKGLKRVEGIIKNRPELNDNQSKIKSGKK